MGIKATLVKTLREKTGAGVIACKNALAATAGDFDAAVERLREAELANAAKKANGVAVERAANPEALAHIGPTLAMHVAAQAPLYVSREEIPSEVVAAKRAELAEQARHSGKPASIVEKMIDGRMRKFYDEVVLVQQPFVLNPDQDVAQAIRVAEQSVGAAIAVTAFVRFKTGERLETEASR